MKQWSRRILVARKLPVAMLNVRVSSGKAGNPRSALKTGCLHNLVEGHGQVLSRETGQGLSGRGRLASNPPPPRLPGENEMAELR